MSATEKEIHEYLNNEYDTAFYIGDHVWFCYIDFLEESHKVTLENDGFLWGYNPATNHKWQIN